MCEPEASVFAWLFTTATEKVNSDEAEVIKWCFIPIFEFTYDWRCAVVFVSETCLFSSLFLTYYWN